MAFGVTGCGSEVWDKDPLAWIGPGGKSRDKTAAPPPDETTIVMEKAAKAAQEESAPFEAPVQLRTLGVNLETYLAGDITDPNERLKRLEYSVIALHKDLESLAKSRGPVVLPVSSNVIESQSLTERDYMPQEGAAAPLPPATMPEDQTDADINADSAPQSLLGEESQPAPPLSTPYAQPVQSEAEEMEVVAQGAASQTTATATMASPAPQPMASHESVGLALRVGEHPDKMRLVVDVSKDTGFSVDLDNSEKILLIELTEARWGGPAQESFKRMPLLKSYKAESSNGSGSMIIVQLDRETTILSQSKMPALSGSGQRIVIDLQK